MRLPAEVTIALVRVAGLIGALGVLFALLPLQGDRWWLGLAIGAVAVAATLPVAVRRARRVLHSKRPVLEAVEATALLTALLVVGFSAVYLAIDRRGDQFDGLVTRIDAVYFTVTTLSTVGYGDISATGQAARVAVTVQIVFDLSLLGLSVRLLSLAARHRMDHPD